MEKNDKSTDWKKLTFPIGRKLTIKPNFWKLKNLKK